MKGVLSQKKRPISHNIVLDSQKLISDETIHSILRLFYVNYINKFQLFFTLRIA